MNTTSRKLDDFFTSEQYYDFLKGNVRVGIEKYSESFNGDTFLAALYHSAMFDSRIFAEKILLVKKFHDEIIDEKVSSLCKDN